jgi:hypothetical protein
MTKLVLQIGCHFRFEVQRTQRAEFAEVVLMQLVDIVTACINVGGYRNVQGCKTMN